GRPFWVALGTAAFGLALLAVQARWVIDPQRGRGVAVEFLRVWGRVAPVLWLDLLASFAYPLLFFACFPRVAWQSVRFRYACALTLAAVGVGMLLCETPYAD